MPCEECSANAELVDRLQGLVKHLSEKCRLMQHLLHSGEGTARRRRHPTPEEATIRDVNAARAHEGFSDGESSVRSGGGSIVGPTTSTPEKSLLAEQTRNSSCSGLRSPLPCDISPIQRHSPGDACFVEDLDATGHAQSYLEAEFRKAGDWGTTTTAANSNRMRAAPGTDNPVNLPPSARARSWPYLGQGLRHETDNTTASGHPFRKIDLCGAEDDSAGDNATLPTAPARFNTRTVASSCGGAFAEAELHATGIEPAGVVVAHSHHDVSGLDDSAIIAASPVTSPLPVSVWMHHDHVPSNELLQAVAHPSPTPASASSSASRRCSATRLSREAGVDASAGRCEDGSHTSAGTGVTDDNTVCLKAEILLGDNRLIARTPEAVRHGLQLEADRGGGNEESAPPMGALCDAASGPAFPRTIGESKRRDGIGTHAALTSRSAGPRLLCKPAVQWVRDEDADTCQNSCCRAAFGMFLRRHHCRMCGGVFCGECTSRELSLLDPSSRVPLNLQLPVAHKVCNTCFAATQGHDVVAPSHTLRPPLAQQQQQVQRGSKRESRTSTDRTEHAPCAAISATGVEDGGTTTRLLLNPTSTVAGAGLHVRVGARAGRAASAVARSRHASETENMQPCGALPIPAAAPAPIITTDKIAHLAATRGCETAVEVRVGLIHIPHRTKMVISGSRPTTGGLSGRRW